MAVIQEAWVSGVSTRRVDDLVQAMGLSGIGKSTVSKLPRSPPCRRMAVSLARRHLPQAARGRPHRLGGGDNRRGVKLVISDAHEGLKAAIRRVMGSSWQRCRVHWMRNALSYVPKAQQSMVSAALRQAFIQPDRPSASQTLRHVADQLRTKWPKLGAFIDESEADVLAHMVFPSSTGPRFTPPTRWSG